MSHKTKLSTKLIENLQPPASGRRVVYDTKVSGLCISLTANGARTWLLYTRYPGPNGPTPARRALGPAPRPNVVVPGQLTLEEARTKAEEWLKLIAKDIDPAEHAKREAAARRRARQNTFVAVAEDFIAECVKHQRKARDVEREIRRALIPRWGLRPITDITIDDLVDLCSDFKKRGTIHDGHNVFGHARRLFRWAIQMRRYGLDRSPCADLDPSVLIGKKVVRDRVLANDEIVAFWKATETLSYPYADVMRLLLLTGARRAEVAEARWSEFDLGARLWRIPAARYKSAREHVVPLSADAMAVMRSLPTFAGGDFVFTTTGGRKSINGLSKAKRQLDAAMLEKLREAACEQGRDPDRVELRPFVLHDLRRVVRSKLSELRVPLVVAELVIGHTLPGLLKVYDKFEAIEERRDALEKWAMHLRMLLGATPQGGNVVMLRGR